MTKWCIDELEIFSTGYLRTHRWLILAAVLVLSFDANAQPRPNANTIVKRMATRYATLSSYQDEGMVVTTHDEPTGGRIEKQPFKTFFKRPGLLRFEWLEYTFAKVGRSSVIWSNGKEAFTYWEPDRYEKSKSLELAIAGATGISRGSAYTVPTLLIPEYASFRLTELVGLQLAGEETIDGASCYHLKGLQEKDPLELWIGKQDYLLRKLREERKDEGGTVSTEEFHRGIRTNHEIAKDLFDFKPPIALQTPKNPPADVDVSRLLSEDGLLPEDTPNWKDFNSEEGRFSLLLPGTPRSQSVTTESSQGRFEHHIFMAMSAGYICSIDYVDLPNQALGPDTEKVLFDASRDQWLKEVGGKLVSEATVSVDRHEGREIRMLVFDGEARVQLFLIDGRFYQFSIANVRRSKNPDDRIDQFFKSLKVFSRSKPTAAMRDSQPKSESRSRLNPNRRWAQIHYTTPASVCQSGRLNLIGLVHKRSYRIPPCIAHESSRSFLLVNAVESRHDRLFDAGFERSTTCASGTAATPETSSLSQLCLRSRA